jgi:hypothetical protein
MSAGTYTCTISHIPWRSQEAVEVELLRELTIGRAPRGRGMVVGGGDDYVSANAVHLKKKTNGVEIANTSSHSAVEVHHPNGVRIIFPSETLTVNSSSRLVLPSKDVSYIVEIKIEGHEPATQQSGHTRRLVPEDLTIAEERIPALAGLCATYLFPQRFGTAPLKASEIASLLRKSGLDVTAKAINHKIQRTREQVEEHTGMYLDDREGLAQFLIRNKYVTADHVKKYLME